LQEILLKGKKGQLLTEIWVNCAEKQAFSQKCTHPNRKMFDRKTNKPVNFICGRDYMTIWFCVKTTQTPNTVAEVVCAFNTFEEETSKGKCVWIIEKGKGIEEYWQILSKYEHQKELRCVALVYQKGDTVILGEVADEVLPNFLAPLLARYGFDNVKWIVANPKR
jgi:hypothetical protein